MFIVTSDPVVPIGDMKAMLSITDEQQAILLVNALSAKARRFLNRVQLNEDQTTAIIERIIPYGGARLYLHAPIWTGNGFTIEAKVYEGRSLQATYTYADGSLDFVSDDYESYLAMMENAWPEADSGCTVQVTYKGGWSIVPADVVQGALMQGRVDLARLRGEVGMNSHADQGATTTYQTAGIIKETADAWLPYKVIV